MPSNVSDPVVPVDVLGLAWAPASSGIPLRHRLLTLAGYDPTVSPAAERALRAAVLVSSGELSNLVLIGRPGAGKTHLAAAICNATWSRLWASWQAAGGDVRVDDDGHSRRFPMPAEPMWCNVPVLLSQLKAEMRTQDRDAHHWGAELGRHPGLVVLDDLGRERVSDWTGEVLYVLINQRYEAQRSTVVTSNLTVAELAANGYEPALSRLTEDGTLIEMASAVDYRTRRTPSGSAS